jgi:hypothetical protein
MKVAKAGGGGLTVGTALALVGQLAGHIFQGGGFAGAAGGGGGMAGTCGGGAFLAKRFFGSAGAAASGAAACVGGVVGGRGVPLGLGGMGLGLGGMGLGVGGGPGGPLGGGGGDAASAEMWSSSVASSSMVITLGERGRTQVKSGINLVNTNIHEAKRKPETRENPNPTTKFGGAFDYEKG